MDSPRMSTTPSTDATLVGDAADAPVAYPTKKSPSPSLAPLHMNGLMNDGPFNPTTPSRPFLKRSSTSIGQRRPISSKFHVDTRGHNSKLVLPPPRSIEQLCGEQSYLMACQANQEQRCRDLMRRLATVEDALNGECPPDQRRKTKKQASLLKSKIAGAAEQEKAILGRLGEVFVEMQSRERWMQVQTERRASSVSIPPPWIVWEAVDSPISDMTTPMVSSSVASPPFVSAPTMGARLDAKSPEFIPMGHFQFPQYDLSQQSRPLPLQSEEAISPLTEGTGHGLGVGLIDLSAFGDVLRNHNLLFEYEDLETPKEQVPASQDAGSRRTRHERRLSLPSLMCMWPGSESIDAFKEEAGQSKHRMNGTDWAVDDKDEDDEVVFILQHKSPS